MISNRILNRPFAAAALAVVLVFSGCQDESFLDTTNINQPDESRALGSPSDVESLVKGAAVSYFAAHDYGGYEHLLVSSDVMTCSWVICVMKESSS